MNFWYKKSYLFSDIRKSFSMSENRGIFWYQKIISDIRKRFSDIRNWFSDIRKWFSDIRNSHNFWYQKLIFWYQKLISDIRKSFSDIRKSALKSYLAFHSCRICRAVPLVKAWLVSNTTTKQSNLLIQWVYQMRVFYHVTKIFNW